MATYIDERNAAIAAIQALIAPNGVGAITGQVHQDNEVGQTNDAYLNLVGYDNFGFVIVRTGIDPLTGTETNTAAQNGTNLLAAYAAAATLTPNGNPLSANNRAAVLVPPGVYSFGASFMLLNTEFVDIIGLGAPEDVVITSSYSINNGLGTISKNVDDVLIKNITIRNDATFTGSYTGFDASGYAIQSTYANEKLENVIFHSKYNANPYMRIDVTYAGTYTNCKAINDGNDYGIKWIMFSSATGTFKDCNASNDYGFGCNPNNNSLQVIATSGSFDNCSCYSGFGIYIGGGNSAAATGTFKNCTAQINSFGINCNDPITATFIQCKSGNNSFGYDCMSNAGIFKDCIGGQYSFSGSANQGVYTNCKSGDFSFNGNSNSGTYTNCIAGSNSFIGYIDGCFGTFTNCIASDNSFGVSLAAANGLSISNFYNCKGGSESFCTSMINGTDSSKYQDCVGGDYSFNSKNINGVYERCTAGEGSFGYSSASSNAVIFTGAKYSYCKGADRCFGHYAMMDSFSEFKYCEAGIMSFGFGATDDPGQHIDSKFYFCKGDDKCFASEVQGPRSAIVGNPITAEFHNCTAGEMSFGSGLGIEMAGLCVNCRARQYSFGCSPNSGNGQWAEASGTFYNCVGERSCFGASTGNFGGAKASGVFYNCKSGTASFGSNGAAKATDCMASGYFEDCSGGYQSFAGHGKAYKSGTFVRCVLYGDSPFSLANDDLGPLVEGGVMEDCIWQVTSGTAKALLVQNTSGGSPAPRILGGKYIAGATATYAIGSGSGSPSAVIAQIRSNGGSLGLIDPTVTNLAIAGTIDAADNFKYVGL